ncbi:hypothetical protein QBE54_05800 [Thermatribacter velox]|jgi:hypothetical protein|uniref:Uncharacterized protein n=1 Tax=Thermatribacter velox TaxID=3039681 RepID=A0ABZ2Y7Z2_9BACT
MAELLADQVLRKIGELCSPYYRLILMVDPPRRGKMSALQGVSRNRFGIIAYSNYLTNLFEDPFFCTIPDIKVVIDLWPDTEVSGRKNFHPFDDSVPLMEAAV